MIKAKIKKLMLKIIDTFGVPIAETPSESLFATAASGWSISDAKVTRLGLITMWSAVFTNASAMANGNQQRVATINSPYRPVNIAGLTSVSFLGLADANGAVYLRNSSGAVLPAGSRTNVCSVYIGENVGGVLRNLSIFKAFRHFMPLQKGGGVDDQSCIKEFDTRDALENRHGEDGRSACYINTKWDKDKCLLNNIRRRKVACDISSGIEPFGFEKLSSDDNSRIRQSSAANHNGCRGDSQAQLERDHRGIIFSHSIWNNVPYKRLFGLGEHKRLDSDTNYLTSSISGRRWAA